MINFSCETIPSAYHSLKDVREEQSCDPINNQSNRSKYNNKKSLKTFENNNNPLSSSNRKKVSWAPNGNITRTNVA